MLYYHVRIETEGLNEPNNSNKLYYEWDMTDLSEIKRRIMMPYLEEKRVRLSKCELPASAIRFIVIVESEWTVDEYHDYLCKKSPDNPWLCDSSLMFNEDDERCVRNITDNLREECELELMNPVRRFFRRVKKILQK